MGPSREEIVDKPPIQDVESLLIKSAPNKTELIEDKLGDFLFGGNLCRNPSLTIMLGSSSKGIFVEGIIDEKRNKYEDIYSYLNKYRGESIRVKMISSPKKEYRLRAIYFEDRTFLF